MKKSESGVGFSPLARHPPFFGKNLGVLGGGRESFSPARVGVENAKPVGVEFGFAGWR